MNNTIFNIVIWPRYSAQVTFKEIASGFAETLNCSCSENFITDNNVINIILGANDSIFVPLVIPMNSIIVNFEQITVKPNWDNNKYIELLKNYPVWDYSDINIEYLQTIGINARKLTVGYSPCLETCISFDTIPDIDVLFCGALNDRRDYLRKKLKSLGLYTVFVSNVFGEERDRLIAKSKIVLNIHYYDSKILEVVRLVHLLANKKCVISEKGSEESINNIWAKGVVLCEYDEIVSNVLIHLFDDKKRHKQEITGYSFIKNYPLILPEIKDVQYNAQKF